MLPCASVQCIFDAIITTDVANMIERNERKRKDLDYLSSSSEITVKSKKPLFSAFFSSRNLDHFLHRNANMKSQEKVLLANAYAARYRSEPKGLVYAIKNDAGTLVDLSCEEL